ncbi:MAG: excinuclease ABC subunit UvrC [Candidatus Cloacimonetes bacterium]|nr:excinuclease ABC subunit UvrC [Candidatus Cloacimonadota bacterium]
MQINEKIKNKLPILPEQPGVYLMRDKYTEIIYVGKALNLKNRLKSYFSGTHLDNKTTHLVNNIDDFEYIITNSEQEAFLLEANLIHQHQPKYNILLKDDKRFPFLKVLTKENFPRLEITRDIVKDGNQYYGPYTDAKALRFLLKDIEWIFPHKTCAKNIKEDDPSTRSCLNYQLGKCPAPCIGKITKAEYQALIKNIVQYILGKNDDLLRDMRREMAELSEKMEFERAAKIRDRIAYIDSVAQRQSAYFNDQEDRDVITFYREEKHIAVVNIKILNGKINTKEIFSFKNTVDEPTESVLRAFLLQYYSKKMNNLPFQILLQAEPEDFEGLNILFKKKLFIPARGDNRKLIDIGRKNAFDYIEQLKLGMLRKSQRTIMPIQELKEYLFLKKLPRKMVCIDISTIQGSETVSSLVFFENGKPLKKHYRHFVIKTVVGQDDFASIAETLDRYLWHFSDENEKTDTPWELPDLIIIDGGKGQLSSAFQILRKHQAENPKLAPLEIVSLAKRIEEVFLPEKSESVMIPRTSTALKVITHLRDEAHRFAITHHRKRRDQRTLSSQLDSVKGLGEHRKFLLLKEFGSVENIKNTSTEDLAKVKGIGQKLAEVILETLLSL